MSLQDAYHAHPLPGKLQHAPPPPREQKPFEGTTTYATNYKGYEPQPRSPISPPHRLRTHPAPFPCLSAQAQLAPLFESLHCSTCAHWLTENLTPIESISVAA